ncbi:MAG: hypothetical protein QM673_15130 [Gordonia sp. (in: high G+C Gram-positive bacteria)]
MSTTNTVPVQLTCSCGTRASRRFGARSATWVCPDCAVRWRAEDTALAAVLDGAAEMRRLRRAVVLTAALFAVVAAILIMLNPPWALGIPVLAGGVGLISRPTYRSRIRHARLLLHKTITVRAD